MNYSQRTDNETKEVIRKLSEDYDKRLVAVKFLKVLCRKGILPGEVMEKLIAELAEKLNSSAEGEKEWGKYM